MTVGIVGCGNLGMSLLNGIRKHDDNAQIVGSRRNIEELKSLSLPNTTFTSSNEELIKTSSIVIIALKPYNVISFLEENRNYFNANEHTIVSVASGVTISEMKAVLNMEIDIFRGMPNTAASVNESITALSFGSDQLNRKERIQELFNTLGETLIIDEKLNNPYL